MGIVTVSAPYGAGGAEIAPAVAERLGVPFHDRAIPAQVAGRLGVPVAEAEANDETVVRGLWRLVAPLGTMPDPVGGGLPTSSLPDARAYRQQTERVLGEIADGAGGVVLGRAGALVLGGRLDALPGRLGRPRGAWCSVAPGPWCWGTGLTPCTCGWTAHGSSGSRRSSPARGARATR